MTDEGLFAQKNFTEDGFVKIDFPDTKQEKIANTCNAEDRLYELRREKSLVPNTNGLDFSQLNEGDLATVHIVKHLLTADERSQLYNKCVEKQFESKFNFA